MKKTLAIILGIGLAATASAAVDLTDLDLSVRTGFITGSLKQPGTDGYTFGGFPMMLGYNLDVSRKVTLGVDLGLVLDAGSFSITRTGMEFSGSYHLFGGSRRLRSDYVGIETIGHEPYDFSLAVRAGFQHYSATAADGSGSTSGSVLETMVGLQYRQDISDTSAISVEAFLTAFSLSASLERLTSSQMLMLFSWRFFL